MFNVMHNFKHGIMWLVCMISTCSQNMNLDIAHLYATVCPKILKCLYTPIKIICYLYLYSPS